MEPSSKKRKLAPKVAVSSAPNPQPAQTLPEPVQQHQDALVPERHDFESFARHLQDAAMLIQRQAERSPYSDVSVLLLRWEEDQSVDEDLANLDQVLQSQYNFNTQRWHIPTVPNPSIKLGVQMAQFLEHGRPNHLLIIYYAGYGYVSSDGQLYWACNSREDAAKLKWDGVRCLFEDAQSDILLLLDTCAIPDPAIAGSHGVKQALAACSPEYNLRQPPARSFTSNVVEALQKLHGRRPFSVRRLFEDVASMASGQTPLFFTITPGKGQNLTLAPLDRSAPQDGEEEPREEQAIDPGSVADLLFDEARILVCTTFVGDASPDMSSFDHWLQNTPPLGATITVEGMFLGPPTILLISMPHSIWTVVQHDKVCCYLGYISSRNMIHLYQKLVGSGRPPSRPVDDGRMLLDNREPRIRDDPEDTAEMQEAAEQLKALSHVRHRSDETPRPRTTLPDSVPHDHEDDEESKNRKAPRRSLPKQETRCGHCSHAPFKDSSSLRKHIAAAHTRPFPCAFSFAGCHSTFGSKNEWKRHIASQHLCLQYYRCSMCTHGTSEGRGNEFNRKDLFTQHLRRMHAPPQIKRTGVKADAQVQAEWDNQVKALQQSCLVSRRLPPQKSACPRDGCQSVFEGASAWDEWTEHVGRHMEKGEGQPLGVDSLLTQWALDEGIIELKDGEYRFCAGATDRDAMPLLAAEASRLEESRTESRTEESRDSRVEESRAESRTEESRTDDSTMQPDRDMDDLQLGNLVEGGSLT
ncbi:hypothetical protein B0I35DRAFT_355732 [Stachybotrys elegans]|uniref:C2H2-type domain-containing protein n=1 Tax=Stachybotrys elegans TaxID=80388 RepID=A0A8K0STU1_9HYPO|nr:hypothetical protein B0I35DRAFT_355732 [Stachybotrys elegans]